MPNDATLLFSFLPQFPSDSATLTSPLPAMIYMTFDGAARGQKADAAVSPEVIQKAIEELLDRGRPVLLGAAGQLLGQWLGQILGVSEQRAGIDETTGKDQRQIPHAEMMPDAVTALQQFLLNNPQIVPFVPIRIDKLLNDTAVYLFREYLLKIIDRSRANFFRGLVASENTVADQLDAAWVVVKPFVASSTTAAHTLEPMRAYQEASADKARDSRRGRQEAHDRGFDEGRQEERQQQETAARAPVPAAPTVLVQPTPPAPPTPPATPPATKTRRRGKRG